MSEDIWQKLRAEFPKSAVSWRAQAVTKNGEKAMALAYLDARDVRKRLNDVVGPANWQNEFRDCGDGKLACRLSIRVDDEWISKEDGAGETQVEAEKGAFSSALKRAAVAFGIGEYLYDMPTPWVPCKSWQDGNKWKWEAWTEDPWDHVKRSKQPPEPPKEETPQEVADRIKLANRMVKTESDWLRLWTHPATLSALDKLDADLYASLIRIRDITKDGVSMGKEVKTETRLSQVKAPDFSGLDTSGSDDARPEYTPADYLRAGE